MLQLCVCRLLDTYCQCDLLHLCAGGELLHAAEDGLDPALGGEGHAPLVLEHESARQTQRRHRVHLHLRADHLHQQLQNLIAAGGREGDKGGREQLRDVEGGRAKLSSTSY